MKLSLTPDILKIDKYFNNGIDQKYWYENEAKKILSLLPEFKEYPIIRAFAVTSMTTSIEANVHLGLKALKQMRQNEPFTGFLPNQITYLNLIRSGQDVPGRKIMNFINALEGMDSAVVVDIWMCRAFNLINKRLLPNGRPYFKAPSKIEYDLIEDFVIQDSKNRDVTPRQYQSMIWTGIKREQGNISKNVCWSDLIIKKKGMFKF